MGELYIQGKGKIDGQGLLGALLGLGADRDRIRERLEALVAFPVQIRFSEISENICAAGVQGGQQGRLSLVQIRADLEQWQEKACVKEWTEKMAELLWQAARVPEDSCFLERGEGEASLLLLAALAVSLEQLGFSRVGFVDLEEAVGSWDGVLFPSEEVLTVLQKSGLCVRLSPGREERLTPVSAAFFAAVGKKAEEIPGKRVAGWSWGVSGEGEEKGRVRGLILEEEKEECRKEEKRDKVQVLETNVDDCSGEQLGYTIDRLMQAGALDASCFPIFMKKGRPAYMLQVICRKEKQEELEDIIFQETTSIGLRRYEESRRILPRSFTEISLKDGHKVKIKICRHHGQKFYYPEYDTLRRVCEETGRSYRSVYEEAAALAGGLCDDI